jgi:hypothetical protein
MHGGDNDCDEVITMIRVINDYELNRMMVFVMKVATMVGDDGWR